MNIKALVNFEVPNTPEFVTGETYFISDELGATLLERGLVEVVVPEVKVNSKPAKEQDVTTNV